jgi:hypothetical protein
MGNTHGKEPWVKMPWVYTTFLVVSVLQGNTLQIMTIDDFLRHILSRPNNIDRTF